MSDNDEYFVFLRFTALGVRCYYILISDDTRYGNGKAEVSACAPNLSSLSLRAS